VGTGFYQNLIVGNYVPDGMTGVQLWISCIENVVAGNSVARQRKPALFFYASGTTLASSMPRTWNRVIAPLFFNHAEGNRSEECNAGALVTSGDAAVFRRNHAYFWYPVNNASDPPVAFQVDTPKATVAFEQNDAEDKNGGGSAAIVRLKEVKE